MNSEAEQPGVRPRPRRAWKWIVGVLGGLVVLLGLALLAFRIALDQVPEYRAQIQAFISERSGIDIAFSGLDARWRLYGPELVFENAVVSAPNGGRTLVAARRGSVALDIWGSLASGRITTGRFWLDAPELLLVRTADGRIELVGQDELPERTQPFRFDELPTGHFSISDARVTFRDLATGRGPWTFARVGLTLERRAASMRLEGTAELPSALGRQLKFAARSSGQLDTPNELHWDFSVESRELALPGLADLLPDAWAVPAMGTGSFKLAGILKGASLENLSGNVSLTGVELPLPAWQTPLPGAEPLVIRSSAAETVAPPEQPVAAIAQSTPGDRAIYELVRATFDLKHPAAGGWYLVVEGLELVRPGMRSTPSRLVLEAGPSTRPLSVKGTAEHVSLDSVWPLLGLLPERADTARLRALNATGRLRDLEFSFARGVEPAPPRYSFSGQFDGVSVAPVGRTPGFAGLTGEVTATDQGGLLALKARNLEFTLPRLFREVLAATQIDATVHWTRAADRWQVASDDLHIRTADGQGTAKFALTLPDDASSPVLDVEATGTDLKVSALPRYVPAGRLTEKSIAWLDRAFPAGIVSTASVAYHGPTRQFPFRGGEGTFVARGQFKDITFDYDPRWVPVTGIEGEVEFRNAGLTARAETGLVNGLQLTEGKVAIADLKTTEVEVRGRVRGDLGAALDYVQRSSVGPALGERFMALEGKGATDIDARLWLPLKQLTARRIDVTARLADAEIGERNRLQKITALNGPVQVLDRAFKSPGLEGRFLGGPVSIVMTTDAAAAGNTATLLTASGQALAAPLKEFLGIPDVAKLSGAARWRMQARFVPSASRRAVASNPEAAVAEATAAAMTQSYVIDSDLQGLATGLPAPMEKAAGVTRPLHVEIDLDGGPALTLRGSLGLLRTVARLQRSGGSWTFDRAGVRADGVTASIPGHEGVRIEGDIDTFVLDDWLALKGDGTGTGGRRRVSDYLKAANVRVGTFGLFGYTWSEVRGLMQATTSGWQIDVAGPDATGKVLVPYDLTGSAPVQLEMERLVVASRAGGAGGQSMLDPRQVPPIEARINEFELGERKLGSVRAQLSRVPRGLSIDDLTAQSESFSAEIKGTWLSHVGTSPTARVSATEVNATLNSTDVQSTLKALGYGDVVSGTRGLLQARLNWPGGPDAGALGRATGTVRVELDDGQVLDLQPGAGRVLGLLSVAALPRRLSLDFSDLTEKGLAFDSVRGDFELRRGDAYTSNLLLSGPAADIGIAGRTGLGTHDYDQTAVVTSNLGATLPVAGALAGGPVGAAAMLLFSQVFKESLKGITRGYYRITGPWDEPHIERVIASDAKEAAAHAPADAAPDSSVSP